MRRESCIHLFGCTWHSRPLLAHNGTRVAWMPGSVEAPTCVSTHRRELASRKILWGSLRSNPLARCPHLPLSCNRGLSASSPSFAVMQPHFPSRSDIWSTWHPARSVTTLRTRHPLVLRRSARSVESSGHGFRPRQPADEAQSRARGQSQILLGDAKPLAGVPDHCADLKRRVFQSPLRVSYRSRHRDLSRPGD
jgi:hypothetical protein